MKQFDKSNLGELRDDLTAALQEVAKKHNITIKAGNASYTDSTVTFKVECAVTDDDGKEIDKYAVALEQYHPDLVNKQLMINRKKFTVVGYKTSARKWSILIRDNATGKRSLTTYSEAVAG